MKAFDFTNEVPMSLKLLKINMFANSVPGHQATWPTVKRAAKMSDNLYSKENY